MATTRLNPITNQLEVFNPTADGYMPLIAFPQITGGFGVALIAAQMGVISDILVSVNSVIENTAINDELLAIISDIEDVQSRIGAPTDSVAAGAFANASIIGFLKYLASSGDSIEQELATLAPKLDSIDQSLGATVNPSTPVIRNFSVGSSAETSFTFPADTKRFAIKARGGPSDASGDIRYAWFPEVALNQAGVGQSNGFDTIPERASYSEVDVDVAGKTIYLVANTASVPVSITYWT